jgi:hypothetical protein
MSAQIELAPPIGTEHSTSTNSVVDASDPVSSSSLPQPTRHSSDEDQTAVPTPAESRSVREPSEASEGSNSVKKETASRSNPNQGNAKDKDEGEKGWTYDQQLKVSWIHRACTLFLLTSRTTKAD